MAIEGEVAALGAGEVEMTLGSASDDHCAPTGFALDCARQADDGPTLRDARKGKIKFGAAARVPMSFDTDGIEKALVEAKVRKEYTRLRKAYLDRRRTCWEVLGGLAESTGKKETKLMEEIGLEGDEEYGVDRKAFPPI